MVGEEKLNYVNRVPHSKALRLSAIPSVRKGKGKLRTIGSHDIIDTSRLDTDTSRALTSSLTTTAVKSDSEPIRSTIDR